MTWGEAAEAEEQERCCRRNHQIAALGRQRFFATVTNRAQTRGPSAELKILAEDPSLFDTMQFPPSTSTAHAGGANLLSVVEQKAAACALVT